MGIRRAAARLAGALLVAAQVAACTQIVSTAGSGAPATATPAASEAVPPSGASLPPSSEVPGSAAPSAAPSATPTAPGVFAPGTAVEVLATELNLRQNPSTSAKVVSLLKRDDVVVISPLDNLQFGWGPVRKNGFDWYPVVQVSTSDGKLPRLPERPVNPADGVPVSGWIAAGEGSKPYFRALPPRCPAVVDLANVAGMLPAERLQCLGTSPFVLEGVFGCGGCGGMIVGTFVPEWLAIPTEFDFLSARPITQLGPLALRFPPDGPTRPAAGTIIRVTVHLQEPRSVGCSIVEGEGADAETVPAVTAELYCRERLVVESYEVLGTDPDFPTG